MLSPRLLDRLANLERVARKRATRWLDVSPLSPDEASRFHHLWVIHRADLTDTEEEEYYVLLGKCRIMYSNNLDEDLYEDDDSEEDQEPDVDDDNVDEDEADQDDDADDDEQDVSEWDPVELAYTIAFSRYWIENPSIALPKGEGQMLNAYLIYIGSRLFEKYGWVAGEPDCSKILPLDEWASGDRWTLIELYKD